MMNIGDITAAHCPSTRILVLMRKMPHQS